MRRLLPLALVFTACAAARPAATPGPRAAARAASLPFIEDDYDRALAEARASRRPLFVDTWAPW